MAGKACGLKSLLWYDQRQHPPEYTAGNLTDALPDVNAQGNKMEMKKTLLGLDIGANSVGWALLSLSDDGRPDGLLDAGVRIFEEGVELPGGSKKTSTNAKRGTARRHRRTLARRAGRVSHVERVLAEVGLLPAPEIPSDSPRRRRAALHRIETGKALGIHRQVRKPGSAAAPDEPEMNPYELRKRALDSKLKPYELGRVFVHLARRRGFRSNSAAAAAEIENEGVVKKKVSELQSRIEETDSRTLGEYWASLNPHERRIRGEGHYTSRKMYEEEFEAIWESQRMHYPDILTDGLKQSLKEEFEVQTNKRDGKKKRIGRGIFHQRSFRLPKERRKKLLGRCDLEKKSARAPLDLLISQECRMLQEVNHLRLENRDCPLGRGLTAGERTALVRRLSFTEKLPFDELRALLDLPEDTRFTIEQEGRDSIYGNTTAARLRTFTEKVETGVTPGGKKKPTYVEHEVFGVQWDSLSPDDQERVVEDFRSFKNRDALVRKAMRPQMPFAERRRNKGKWGWGLPPERAERLRDVRLEEGYSGHSLKALEKLRGPLREGLSYAEAKLKAGYLDETPEAAPKLKSVKSVLGDIRNPIVVRSLTETRKVVNAIIARHGKPSAIRIELARDLKKNAEQRKKIQDTNSRNQRERDQAAREMPEGVQRTRRNIEKWILYEECNHECPYTGEEIRPTTLYGLDGGPPRFEIEHIIPKSMVIDNSFLNKTLCHIDANKFKSGRVPREAYPDGQDWKKIRERVANFSTDSAQRRPGRGRKKGAAVHPKLKRFLLEGDALREYLEAFREQQLNNTAHASKLARRYLATLYGEDWRKCIRTGNGQITAELRRQRWDPENERWNMNSVLNDGEGKSRDVQWHHAVDAVCVALTSDALVQSLSNAHARTPQGVRPRHDSQPPWPGFRAELERVILGITVSHRTSRNVTGPLHKEHDFGWIIDRDENGRPVLDKKTGKPKYSAVRRRWVYELTAAMVPDIVDMSVRTAVRDCLVRLADVRSFEEIEDWLKLRRLLKASANHPWLKTKRGNKNWIHRVRVRTGDQPRVIGHPDKKVERPEQTEFEPTGRKKWKTGERLVNTGGNSHLEIFEVTETRGKNKGAKVWKGEVVTRLDAMTRKKNKQPVVRRQNDDGNPRVMVLRIGDAVELTWTGKKPVGPAGFEKQPGERVIAVVQQLSQNEYVFQTHHDARKAGEKKSQNFYAKGAGPFQKMSPVKLTITPLGEIIRHEKPDH